MPLKLAVLLLGLIVPLQLSAAEYIDAAPLDKVVSTPLHPVRGGEATIVPIITWGGDIATVVANGNAAATAPGSIFARLGLNLRLTRQDIFSRQLESYLSGETPYLRGTLGMINQAADLLRNNPGAEPIIVYQLTWSAGGDALVVKSGIRTAKDLKGKTIALQAYGPHVDYMTRILADAGLSAKDVKIRWTRDLTGSTQTPPEAMHDSGVDAALAIIPDALALTSGGRVGSGAEDSVKGATILLSTKTANRIIADVYAVRADYFAAHRDEVEKFVRGLLLGTEALQKLHKNKTAAPKDYQTALSAAAKALLDSEQATEDTEGMYHDAEFVGFDGNVRFFQDGNYPRRMEVLNAEAQAGLAKLGLVKGDVQFAKAGWNYALLQAGLSDVGSRQAPRFDESKVAAAVSERQKTGALEKSELFSFDVFFAPNQNSFSVDFYQKDFNKVIDLASTYGGAVITVEGHSDPMAYLRKAQENATPMVLGQIKQSAKNLSLSRAQQVRDSIIQYAGSKGISLDPSQFAVVGHGIAAPKTGICGNDPCAPKTEEQWRSNMRVEFRILQIEAEESAFKPL
jgi:ABC-type nitrate/sulfonate/bicarbonate transport system substrate-binding protein/outer membrane protein OmpA-like peptidoglycan-associated protein